MRGTADLLSASKYAATGGAKMAKIHWNPKKNPGEPGQPDVTACSLSLSWGDKRVLLKQSGGRQLIADAFYL